VGITFISPPLIFCDLVTVTKTFEDCHKIHYRSYLQIIVGKHEFHGNQLRDSRIFLKGVSELLPLLPIYLDQFG